MRLYKNWVFRRAMFRTPKIFQACAEACACDGTPYITKPGYVLLVNLIVFDVEKVAC